jgi:hypothetical protein
LSGPGSLSLATTHADALISVEPDGDLVDRFNADGGANKPKYGQLAICCDRDAPVPEGGRTPPSPER